jgi:hypothetical protein
MCVRICSYPPEVGRAPPDILWSVRGAAWTAGREGVAAIDVPDLKTLATCRTRKDRAAEMAAPPVFVGIEDHDAMTSFAIGGLRREILYV